MIDEWRDLDWLGRIVAVFATAMISLMVTLLVYVIATIVSYFAFRASGIEGVVIDKYSTDPYTIATTQCVPSGKTTVCYPSTTTHGRSFYLIVDKCGQDGECNPTDWEVGGAQYYTCEPGDWYASVAGECSAR